MKIIYLVHQYFPRHVGGTEVYVRGLARRARAHGYEPTIITCVESAHIGPPYVVQTKVDALPVLEIHNNYSQSHRPGRDEYADPRIGDLVDEILKDAHPGLVHIAHTMKLGAECMQRCERLGIPMIVTLCDFWFICPRHTLLRANGQCCSGPDQVLECLHCMQATHAESSFRIYNARTAALSRYWHRLRHWRDIARRPAYLRQRLHACKEIIALSAFAKRMHEANGIQASRITVVPHGLEDFPANPGLPPPEYCHIVFIGSLVPHKGVHVLLDALQKIPAAKLRCSIYGAVRAEDPYHRRLLEQVRRDNRVVLAGTFSPEQIWQVLDAASLLALPSLWYENEPLVVKAALHRGVPVLASALGSLIDQVQHDKNGWLFPAGDVEAMAGILDNLAKRPEQCRVPPVPDTGMDLHAQHIFSLYREHSRP